jgi:hypothetical protein
MYRFIIAMLIIFVLHKIYRLFVSPVEWERPKVLLGTEQKVIVFTAYDFQFAKKEYVSKHAEIIKKYCQKHGHEFKQVIGQYGDTSPYWIRVKILKDILENSDENVLVVYLDADAIPIHMDLSIDSFINTLNSPTFDIFISEDPMIEINPVYPGLVNTGVFIVRNTQRAREFIKKWEETYDPSKWFNSSGVWRCYDNYIPCLYSGSNYEQGSFSKLYKEYKDLIKPLKYNTLACQKNSPECFVMHLMGESDESRLKIFQGYLEE